MNPPRISATRLRVRYQETDAMGVVYYGNYFTWFELGRTDLLASAGYPYRRLEAEGFHFMVVDASCRYQAPCRYDQEVVVENWVTELRASAVIFEHAVKVEGEKCAEGRTTLVFTNSALRPARIPDPLKKALLKYLPA